MSRSFWRVVPFGLLVILGCNQAAGPPSADTSSAAAAEETEQRFAEMQRQLTALKDANEALRKSETAQQATPTQPPVQTITDPPAQTVVDPPASGDGDVASLVNDTPDAPEASPEIPIFPPAQDPTDQRLAQARTLASAYLNRSLPAEKLAKARTLALELTTKYLRDNQRDVSAYMLIALLHKGPEGDIKVRNAALKLAVDLSKNNPELQARALLLRGKLSSDSRQQQADFTQALLLNPQLQEARRLRGYSYMQSGQFARANADFDAILATEATNHQAMQGKARVLLSQNKAKEALKIINMSIALQPKNPLALIVRSDIHLALNDTEAQLADLDKVLKLIPNNTMARMGRARQYFALERFEDALADVDKVLNSNDGLNGATALRSEILLKQGKAAGAIAELERDIRQNPDNMVLKLQLADVHRANDDLKSAVEVFTKVLAEDGENIGALMARAEFQLGAAKDEQQRDKSLQLALTDLKKVVQVSPDFAPGWLQLARINIQAKGEPKESIAAIDKAIELSASSPPLQSECYILRAALAKESAERLQLYDLAVKASPGNMNALQLRASQRVVNGQARESLADFQKIADTLPENKTVLVGYAEALLFAGEKEKALKTIDNTIVDSESNSVSLTLRAKILASLKRNEDALASLTKAIETDPKNLEAHLICMQLLRQAKEHDKAMAYVVKALEISPENPSFVVSKVQILAAQEKYEQALSTLQEHNQTKPQTAYRFLQGDIYLASGDTQRAIRAFTKILKDQPESLRARIGRANAWVRAGQPIAAIEDYRAALKEKPDYSDAQNNLAWILATDPADDIRDGAEALQLATAASNAADHQSASRLSTLAAALAETGDFKKAEETCQQALALAKTDKQRTGYEKELAAYTAKKPWRVSNE